MQLIVYILVYPFIWLISKLPFPLLYAFSDGCYILVYRILGYRKKTVRYNLETAFPDKTLNEIRSIERKFYHHLCDMFLEMIKSLSISEDELKKRYLFTNPEILVNYENQGQSTSVMMGHFASYEWVFALQLYLKNPGHAIYKKIANKYFDRLVHKIRGKWKANLVPSKKAFATIEKLQKEGAVTAYGFISDQSPKPNRSRFWTSFLGHDLPFATGAERIAKMYDLPIIFLATTKVKRGYYKAHLTVLSENITKEKEGSAISAFAKALEQQILVEPHLYLWTHKRFKHLGKKEAFKKQFNFD